jgi:diguanylate cyclase (GGDEF)-like protein
MLINSYRSLLGNDMLSAFMNKDFSTANVLLLTHISNSGDFLEVRRQVMSHVAEKFSRDIQWHLTGFGMVISASSYHLTLGQIKSLSLTMISIMVIMFVLFLSIKVGCIAVLPNLFPIIVNFGMMGWLDIELSMATSLIASVAIGLAVDDTIHYLVRFNREFRKDLDEQRALKDTLTHMGRPILFTTVTISLGFTILLFSSFKPTAIFGGMMVITMLSALVGDLILLPALMQRIELVTLWDLVRIKLGKDPSLEVPLFKGLTRTEMHSVMMAGTLVSVPAGEVLFRKGDISGAMYAVISGSFGVYDYESDEEALFDHGIHKQVSSCHAGDVIGEMGLLRAMPRSASVVATADSELLLINWRVVRRMQWLYPPIAVKFFKNMAEILSDRLERLTHCLTNETCIDDVTGICNRQGVCQILETEVKRSSRYQEPLCLSLLELDFDGYAPGRGRDMRQNVVRVLARRWRETIRSCDTMSRISVQRFLLVFPKADPEKMDRLKERLETVTNEMQAYFDPIPFSVNISTISLPLDMDADGEYVLDEALRAMGVESHADSPSDHTCAGPWPV